MKERTINIVFAVMTALFGVALFVFGLKEAGVDTDVADEKVIDMMALTIPGILLFADAVMYLLRPKFPSDKKFLLSNLGLVILIGFLAECIYFQFFHYGIHQPQLKMTIPAILIVLVLALLVLILNGMYLCVRRIAKLSK
ncbi:MAG: hypothetical protein J6Y10_08055 [Lachnospiraceae bacterium]|nr:hypothetical protein [Lachnospiraceae bacterium]